jgi:hypothetical protein
MVAIHVLNEQGTSNKLSDLLFADAVLSMAPVAMPAAGDRSRHWPPLHCHWELRRLVRADFS